MGCDDEKLSKYLTHTFMAHCHTMICQQVTLSGEAEWPKVADAVIEARIAIVQQLIRGRFVLKVDGNGPVVACLVDRVAHGASSGQMVVVADDPQWGNACPIARGWGRRRGVTT